MALTPTAKKASAVLPTRPEPNRRREPQQNRRSPEFYLLSTPWLFSVACLIYAGLAVLFYSQGNKAAAMFFAGGAVTVGAAAVWLFGDKPKDDV